MEKPDLNRMWETFIKIPVEKNEYNKNRLQFISKTIYNIIRFKMYPMISHFKDSGLINWYCFLIHSRNSGVPTSENDDNPYFHIRVELRKDINPDNFLNSLPNYCVMTRKIKHEKVESIEGIDKSIIKNEKIEEAWKIIGEISELIINILNIHKEDTEIPCQQIYQFLHFCSNITQLQIK